VLWKLKKKTFLESEANDKLTKELEIKEKQEIEKNKKGIQAPILKRDVTSKPEIKITMEGPASAEDLIDKKLQNEKIKREEEIKRKGEHAVQKNYKKRIEKKKNVRN